jgi:hypothetical protein
MSITLTTRNGPLDLNNGTSYFIQSIDLGQPNRDEVWIEPNISGVFIEPTLVASVDKKTACAITIAVKGTSVSDLRTKVQAVADEFDAANAITWALNGLSTKTFNTYPTAIEIPDLADREKLYVANSQFWIPTWTFSVWRSAVATSGSRFAI